MQLLRHNYLADASLELSSGEKTSLCLRYLEYVAHMSCVVETAFIFPLFSRRNSCATVIKV